MGRLCEGLFESESDYSIDVIPLTDLSKSHSMVPILVRLECRDASEATPSDFCCVIDVSGSMGLEAKIQGQGEQERHGLSLLDVAKHGVRTVAKSLSAKDRMCIVSFNHDAEVVMPLTFMDEAGQAAVDTNLDKLVACGGTNIWTGLFKGFEAIRADGQVPGTARFAHMMMLTDGESNCRETIIPNLEEYRKKYERLPCTINTFGFGYNIDSKLLRDLSEIGDGSYCFIPDAGFVGTCFVNTMSNLLVVAARDVFLQLEAEDGAKVLEVAAGHPVTVNKDFSSVRIGTLHYGQHRDVIVCVSTKKAGPCLTVNASLIPPGAFEPIQTEAVTSKEIGDPKLVEPEMCRTKLVDTINDCLHAASGAPTPPPSIRRFSAIPALGSDESSPKAEDGSRTPRIPPTPRSTRASQWMRSVSSLFMPQSTPAAESKPALTHAFTAAAFNPSRTSPNDVSEATLKTCQEGLSLLVREIKEMSVADDPFVKALLEDIQGQATEALSCKDYFLKWGRHYLPSLMFAHRLQQCNNFKDPGVQFYGGKLFEKARDFADEMFNTLPAPKASIGTSGPVDMAAYNNRYAGCIDGNSIARLADGEEKLVSELRKGDKVQTGSNSAATILCVVKTHCEDGVAPMVTLEGGARLTPYHPVLIEGIWRFPADLNKIRLESCRAVYNFVLDSASSISVNNVPCIVLGHGIEDGAARHPYYSSIRAVQDIEKRSGFKDGLVVLATSSALRDPETGLVCGIREED